MRLTVLGSAASYAGAGEACSGYLVEGGGARVLLDAGNGTLSNLAKVMDPAMLDAIFITHNHPDHYLDLYSLQSLLRYAPEGPAAPIAVYLPSGLSERMQSLLSDRGTREFAEAFVTADIQPGDKIGVGDLSVTAFQVPHTEPTFALAVEADGARLVYSADTEFGEEISTAARGADLLLAEATLPEAFEGAAPHMTASQAGALAHEAGAGALVLTHVWPTNDRALMLEQARRGYPGPIAVAKELDVFEVRPRGTDL